MEDFYAFTDRRPDGEKWELFDGELVLNASPGNLHQWIVRNLFRALSRREDEIGADWTVLTGIGVRITDMKRPEPDVAVVSKRTFDLAPRQRDTTELRVAFEVMSPSTADRDLKWKRAAYASLWH